MSYCEIQVKAEESADLRRQVQVRIFVFLEQQSYGNPATCAGARYAKVQLLRPVAHFRASKPFPGLLPQGVFNLCFGKDISKGCCEQILKS